MSHWLIEIMKLHTHLLVSVTASLSTRSACTKAEFIKLPLAFFPEKYCVCAITQIKEEEKKKRSTILLQCQRYIMHKDHLITFTSQIYTYPERLVATKSLSEDNDCQEN